MHMADPQLTMVELLVRHGLLPRERLPQIEINLNVYITKRLCRKVAFGMICAMVSLGDLQCTERESTDGHPLQGGPFPTR